MNAAQRAPARRTARLAAVAAAVFLPATALAAPAHAASSCTVNGVPQPGPVINGTSGRDVITCSFFEQGHVINALGGDDVITFTGSTQGRLNAGDGRDLVTLTSDAELAPGGDLDGQAGGDLINLSGDVLGTVRGGQDGDAISLLEGATTASTTRIRAAKGADFVTFFPGVVNRGLVEGGDDNDVITVPDNQGTVDGGPGDDICFVGGTPPLNCEFP
ncbi:hypothetical protein ACSNOH_12875 [Streptomyces sp. URMC 127]|uniref:hypothetical protein n=1 Tax=Streptomyces sp. URMC 127 TaxID=3423402 RepID=UPI003F1BCF4D